MRISSIQANLMSNVNFTSEHKQVENRENYVPDSLSLSKRDKMIMSENDGLEAAKKFRNSTSGYRGSTKGPFNDKFVYSMTNAVVDYMKDNDVVVTMVGGDTRNATKKYAPIIKGIFMDNSIAVYVPKLKGAGKDEISPVATPVLAVATRNYDVPLSVLLTASHNPWEDGGYNFLTDEGAIADEKVTEPLADNLEKITKSGRPNKRGAQKNVFEIEFDPYKVYARHLNDNKIIDFDKIRSQDIQIFYEDFGGTGGYYFPYLLSENGVKLEKKLSSKTKGPNPDEANLSNLAKLVNKSDKYLKIGLANDGDSDRFGVIDENGKFISADDVILLASYHAIKNKGQTYGTLITNQASSAKIQALADYFNANGCDIDTVQTPVGFKYISRVIEELNRTPKPFIVAGEESGGLTVRNNIPEKDGFVALLTMLELIASENKPIGEILKEVNEKIGGNYVSKCINVKFKTDEAKNDTVSGYNKYLGDEDEIAGMKIDCAKTENHKEAMTSFKKGGDGVKIYLQDGSSVLVRKSGTEPIMRLYVNGVNPEAFSKLSKVLVEDAKAKGGVEQ